VLWPAAAGGGAGRSAAAAAAAGGAAGALGGAVGGAAVPRLSLAKPGKKLREQGGEWGAQLKVFIINV